MMVLAAAESEVVDVVESGSEEVERVRMEHFGKAGAAAVVVDRTAVGEGKVGYFEKTAAVAVNSPVEVD